MSSIPVVAGVRLAVAQTNIKYKNRDDLALIEFSPNTNLAAVFTKNSFAAAPVEVCKGHLGMINSKVHQNQAIYLIINAGNANAATGKEGINIAKQVCLEVSLESQVMPVQVMPFSTGVIGELLDVSAISAQISNLYSNLSESAWDKASGAILTTDTTKKIFSTELLIDGKKITINGIAKGSGMINPNMATMLSFIATDAKIETELLQKILSDINERTFNSITVDGDTSTNDSVVLAATGKSGVVLNEKNISQFNEALFLLCKKLAFSIVEDGEGATKFVHLFVKQAFDINQAKSVANSIANSPLVKTAIFAEDPNWGRLVMAVGNGCDCDQKNINIYINGIIIVKNGIRSSSYDEKEVSSSMKKEVISIVVELGNGSHETNVYTTDLSHKYIEINSSYRS